MSTDMDENQARQLEKRIQHEAPHLNVWAGPMEIVGKSDAWVVYIDAEGFNEPLQIENPSAWELQKSALRFP